MHSTPSSVTIAADGYQAEIALRGGQLLSLTSTDASTGAVQDLVVPAAKAEGASAGAVLAPWPNRVTGASYVHAGTTYQLQVNEEETGAAIHGLLHDVDLSVQSRTEHEVHLIGELQPSAGYPFRLQLVQTYRVSSFLGLTSTLSVRYAPQASDDDGAGADAAAAETDAAADPENESSSTGITAPFGAGFHPYLTAGGAPLRACRLRLPAKTLAKVKASGKVVSSKPVSGDLDLTDGPLLAGLRIDHAYTDLPAEGWTAELMHGPSGLLVRMISDTPWAQVYTGERIDRAGVAVEPMTCPPNAFNSGQDLQQLTPWEWTRVGYSIEAIRL